MHHNLLSYYHISMKSHKRLIIASHLIPIEKNVGERVFLKERPSRMADGIRNYLNFNRNAQVFNSAVWIGCADFDEMEWDNGCDEKSLNEFIEIRPLFIRKDIYLKF